MRSRVVLPSGRPARTLGLGYPHRQLRTESGTSRWQDGQGQVEGIHECRPENAGPQDLMVDSSLSPVKCGPGRRLATYTPPMKKTLGALFLLVVSGIGSAYPQGAFSVGSATALPGERANGYIDVPKGQDEGTQIPVIVIHGAKPGPVLALVAGLHGTEYASVVALYAVDDLQAPALRLVSRQ